MIALVVVLISGVCVIGVGLWLAGSYNADLRQTLVESCEDNGNPLRETVRSLLRERIRGAESPLVATLFPQVPRSLVEAQIAADQRRLREVAPVDCEARYP